MNTVEYVDDEGLRCEKWSDFKLEENSASVEFAFLSFPQCIDLIET